MADGEPNENRDWSALQPLRKGERARQLRKAYPSMGVSEIARRANMSINGATAALRFTPKPARDSKATRARQLRSMHPEMTVAEIAKLSGLGRGHCAAVLDGYLARRPSVEVVKRTTLELISPPRTRTAGRVPKDEQKRQLTIVTTNPELQHTRGDCKGGPRPCPLVSCRHHIALEKFEGGTARVYEIGTPSCSLDVADEGAKTLEEVAAIMGITRERVRQIEAIAMRKVKHAAAASVLSAAAALAAHHNDPADRRHQWEDVQ